jgi:protein TonB
MPANLFDPASRPASAGASRRFTVVTSIAIHAGVVVLVVVLPLIGAVSMPAAMNRIDAFVAPPELPPMPVAQPPSAPRSAPAVNPDAAPIHVPATITDEVSTPVRGVPEVPGALPIGPGVGPASVPGGAGEVSIAQPPPPEKPAIVRAGGKVAFPKRIIYAEPVYPPIAQSARVEGTVILEATINESGDVVNIRVLRSIPLLDAAAKEAVAKWRYSPTTLNGERVPVLVTVTVTFSLR